MKLSMKVLAIDPGYGRVGFAVMEKSTGKPSLIFSECLEIEKGVVFSERLIKIGEREKELIQTHKPNCVVIEQLFFAKNKKTALQTAEARGVCVYVAKKEKMNIVEYTPKQVKSAITGNGNANKREMMRMLPLLIKIDMGEKRYDDEYDAIAIAITYLEMPQGLRAHLS